MQDRPIIGVGVIVYKDTQVLLGHRCNAHGGGSWGFPGGHLEFGEDVIECVKREVLEETALYVKELKIGPWTNDIFKDEDKHYVTLFILAKYNGGTPKVREPNKCKEWLWFEWGHLPNPLFLPIQNLLAQGFPIPKE